MRKKKNVSKVCSILFFLSFATVSFSMGKDILAHVNILEKIIVSKEPNTLEVKILLNQYSAGLTFQNRWDSPLMESGTHTVAFRHPGGSHYIDLDAIIITDPETTPPAAVSLSAATGTNTGEVDLTWTAPGDDGNTGTATAYILRYADSAIDSQSAWDAAADVSGEPAPQIAGTGSG